MLDGTQTSTLNWADAVVNADGGAHVWFAPDFQAHVAPGTTAGILMTNVNGTYSNFTPQYCYQLVYNPGNFQLAIRKIVNWGSTDGNPADGASIFLTNPLLSSTGYDLRLQVLGNGVITAWLDGAPLLTWYDASPLPAGQVGVQAAVNVTYYDHIAVNRTNCVTPGPTPGARPAGPKTPTPDLPPDGLKLVVVPNPAQDHSVVSVDLGRASHIRLGFYSLDGRLVKTVDAGALPQGRTVIPVDLRELARGMYYVAVDQDGAGYSISRGLFKLAISR